MAGAGATGNLKCTLATKRPFSVEEARIPLLPVLKVHQSGDCRGVN
jgi:hypothetical protein